MTYVLNQPTIIQTKITYLINYKSYIVTYLFIIFWVCLVETLDTSTPSTLLSVAHFWDLSVVVAWEHPAGRGLLEAQASPIPVSLRHEQGLWSGYWLHSALMAALPGWQKRK